MTNNYFFLFFRSFFRSIKIYLLMFPFIYAIFFNNFNMFILFLYVIIDEIINKIAKSLFRLIMKNKGNRPPEASDCSPLLIDNEEKKKLSYGMPSGHVQTFALIATLIFLRLYQQQDEFIIQKTIFLVGLTFISMYMRVKVEKCHTFEQTLVGLILGIILALSLVKIYKNPF